MAQLEPGLDCSSTLARTVAGMAPICRTVTGSFAHTISYFFLVPTRTEST